MQIFVIHQSIERTMRCIFMDTTRNERAERQKNFTTNGFFEKRKLFVGKWWTELMKLTCQSTLPLEESRRNRSEKKNGNRFFLFVLCSLFCKWNNAKLFFGSNSREKQQHHFHLFIPSHPVNLSISLTGGKEIKRDVPSNGEWKGHLAHN